MDSLKLSPADKRRIALAMAAQAKQIAERAAVGAVGGDRQHSGWGVPLDIKARAIGDSAMISPTRQSAGPWTEVERGRHADGGVGRFQGPGVNMRTGNTSRTRTGRISIRRRSGVRWNGMTRARGTASDAVAEIERRTPQIAEREIKLLMRRHVDVT